MFIWSINLSQSQQEYKIEKTDFSLMLGKLYSYKQKKKPKKLDHILITYIKINSRYIKDVSVRPEIMKLLEEYIRQYTFDIDLSNFLKISFL